MSLFDPPTQDKLSDHFPEGTPFWLLGAKYEGVQPTSFGDSPQAAIVVCPPNVEQDAKQYRVWGTLAEQVHAMEPGDIPAEVSIVKSGRKNVWRLIQKLDSMTGVEGLRQVNAGDTVAVQNEEPPF